MRLKIQARIRQRPATGTPRQSRLARASLHLFAAQRSRRPERILPQKPGERPRPPPPPNATEKASSARDPGRPRYRETAGLERQNEASKGDQDEQPGAQKRKKGPKALFSSTQAETWIMLGAGNETRTRDPDLGKVVLYQLSYSRVLLNFAFVIFAFLRRYGRRIIREIFPSATPQKSFFCVFISSAEIISKTFNLASKSRRRKWIPALT